MLHICKAHKYIAIACLACPNKSKIGAVGFLYAAWQ
nr:MAG TPA: hypothetical protein [Caudoviricetes sp.]